MTTLKEIIEESGENYMEIVRSGVSVKEMAYEMGYTSCENCGDWLERTEMAISSGMAGVDICDHCLQHKSKSNVVQMAIQSALDDQNGNDEWDLRQYLKEG